MFYKAECTVINNGCGNFFCSYVEKYNLEEPSDDIQHVLKCIAVKLGKTKRVKAITGVGEFIHSSHSIFILVISKNY